MRWLSESVEALIAEETARVHAAVVVGSGYGGSVAALRLAEAGREVLVLERGNEYLPGDFPNDTATLPAHLRLERWNSGETQGEESGLFDLRIGESVGVLVGNALGGTSQINANVAIRPDPLLYEQPEWPKALTEPELEKYFRKALDALGVNAFEQRNPPQKFKALERLSRTLAEAGASDGLEGCKVRFAPAHLTVNLHDPGPVNAAGVPTRPCSGCGDCCSGCNDFAKNTLTTTYLAKARAAGARLFTGATVLHLCRGEDEAGPFWRIAFARTSDRGVLRSYREGTADLVHELKARTLILSAGTLGSTEILCRSKAMNGLSLSGALGTRFSGNGDYLAFGYMQDGEVDGVGAGSRARVPGAAPVGPTITGVIRIGDETSIERCTLIEEGSVPGAIAGVFHELVTTMATVSQLTRSSYRGEGGKRARRDPLALQPEGLSHTQTLLAMGHDSARGILCYDEDEDRLRVAWPGLENEAVYKLHDARLRRAEASGAIYLQNPAWRPLPDSVRDALSGPALGNGMFTVHPLGGCPMGGSAETSVVDDTGAVYRESGELHPGLYVLDGSIVPRALGVNPLLTITALSERAMERIVPRVSAAGAPSAAPGLPRYPEDRRIGAAYANPQGDSVALEFTEVLRGSVRYRGESSPRDASLILHLPVEDLRGFFENPEHPIEILGPRGNDVERLAARLEIGGPPGTDAVEEFLVTSGSVRMFERRAAGPMERGLAMLRVALTWFIERGHDELVRALQRFLGISLAPPESSVPLATLVRDWLNLVHHASERRTFTYDIDLWKDESEFRLKGSKLFEYAASWSALWSYACAWLFSPSGKTPYLRRTNVWTSLGLLEIQLYKGRSRIAQGSLTMDLTDMSRRHAPQIASKRDTTTALLALAGYPLMFLRAMIKTRLWDFRLPDYPECVPAGLAPLRKRVPVPEAGSDAATRWPDFPPLRPGPGHGEVVPRDYDELRVRRSRTSDEEVSVRLTRYAQPGLESARTADGMVQVKALVMVNGFAQSTLPFVATEIPCNIAEYFYDQGYDLWLFDYRTSTILDASKQACTMDDVAEHDLPAALHHILGVLGRELGADAESLQIYAFAHCVGSACTAMSMLGGHLAHRGGDSMIAGVILSQMQPFLIGGATAQQRIPVGSVLRDVAGVDVLRLSAAEAKATAFESLLDRLLATLPTPDEERCPFENDRVVDRPDIVTCKRAGGVISRLFNHGRMSEETHRKLDIYFGRANTTLLIHGTKCLDYEHLVNADGQNVYATDANIRRHLRLPIALVHGKDNALFDIESCARTYAQLARVNGRAFARRHYRPIRIKGYAHFDCIVGKDAHRDVYPRLGAFLRRAWRHNGAGLEKRPPDPDPRRASAPVTGPILGWVRREGGKDRARLWIQVDEYEADPASCAMTVLRRQGAEPRVETWPIVRIPLESEKQARGIGHVAIAIADLDLPGECHIDMVGVHGASAVEPDAAPLGDSGDWIRRVQAMVSGADRFRPGPGIPPADADRMVAQLKMAIEETRETALKPNPRTLSRKRRDLPAADTWTAHVKEETLAGLASGGSLQFLAGSCRYPGMTFEAMRADATFRHINTLLRRRGVHRDFMLMLGDQIYADATAGLYDPRSPAEKFRVRYEQAFSSPEFRRLARQMPSYMVIDDHEIDNDWSRDELKKGAEAERLFCTAMSSFAAYQWAHSPRNLAANGFNYRFEAGGCRFLVLDTRTQRVRRGTPAVLAADQIDALDDWLNDGGDDGSPGFIVTGSVLAPGLRSAAPGRADPALDTWQMAPEQRRIVLELVAKSRARNIVFLSGDYHCAATAELDFGGGRKAHAVVAPPFYAPYVYANVQAPEVLRSETIALDGGAVTVTAEPCEGSGYADIRVEALPGKKWSLEVATCTLRFESKTPRFHSTVRRFDLA